MIKCGQKCYCKRTTVSILWNPEHMLSLCSKSFKFKTHSYTCNIKSLLYSSLRSNGTAILFNKCNHETFAWICTITSQLLRRKLKTKNTENEKPLCWKTYQICSTSFLYFQASYFLPHAKSTSLWWWCVIINMTIWKMDVSIIMW